MAQGVLREHERLLVLDTETTGTNPAEDRIVTLALVEVGRNHSEPVVHVTALVRPAIPISSAATAVHGITTEHAAVEGRPLGSVLHEVAEVWNRWVLSLRPIVIFNAKFDWPLLASEGKREGVHFARPWFLDPLVVDRALRRFRKGPRTLSVLASAYGVVLDDAHEAGADAIAAGRLAHRCIAHYPALGAMTPEAAHTVQVSWAVGWLAHYNLWRAGEGLPVIDEPPWPGY